MKRFQIDVDGKKYDVGVDELADGKFNIELESRKYTVSASEIEEARKEKTREKNVLGDKKIVSPITGTVGKVWAKENKTVKPGDVLMTVIAMKMENEVKCELKGKVKKIHVKVGQNVDSGDLLMELE